MPQTLLNITGADANNYSYWQSGSANALLQLDNNSNISAADAFQIDSGMVKVTAPSGGIADELDGVALNFGNTNATFLVIVDSTAGTPGQVTIQGAITLAANTTTMMNFSGANNTADLINDLNDTLTLNGALRLNTNDAQKPTQNLTFFEDTGLALSIMGTFTFITDSKGWTDSGAIVSGQFVTYQVTFQESNFCLMGEAAREL